MTDSVWRELVTALREHRGGHDPRRIARHVCRHADGTIMLAGLTRGARRAVYLDPSLAAAYAVPVSAGGVHAAGIAPPPDGSLAWEHPRTVRDVGAIGEKPR